MLCRRFLLLSLAAVLVGLAVGTWALWSLRADTAITRQSFARIRDGMSREQVEAILGGPPRDESTGPVKWDPFEGWEGPDRDRMTPEEPQQADFEFFREPLAGGQPVEWISDTVMIQAYFRPDGRLLERTCYPACRSPESPFERIRRWLGLDAHEWNSDSEGAVPP